MCLAVPARVVAINGDNAEIDLEGIRKSVSIVLIDEVSIGDYVLVHVGFALEKIDKHEAEATLKLFAQMRSED